uniref:Uncharacterized protein n=1 Tax=Romanomermis culicivorax TaxID=13658 RepID=A0A915HQ71_ROMCU
MPNSQKTMPHSKKVYFQPESDVPKVGNLPSAGLGTSTISINVLSTFSRFACGSMSSMTIN